MTPRTSFLNPRTANLEQLLEAMEHQAARINSLENKHDYQLAELASDYYILIVMNIATRFPQHKFN